MSQPRSFFGNIAVVLTATSNALVTTAQVLDASARTVLEGVEGLEFYSKEFKSAAEFDYSKQQHQLNQAKKAWATELEQPL